MFTIEVLTGSAPRFRLKFLQVTEEVDETELVGKEIVCINLGRIQDLVLGGSDKRPPTISN